MRIECPDCSTSYEVEPSERPRRARCRRCGTLITIKSPAAEPTATRPAGPRRTPARQVATQPAGDQPAAIHAERPARGRRPREKPPLLKSAIVVAIACFLIGLLNLAFAFLSGLGALAMAMDESSSSSGAGLATAMLLALASVGLCLIFSGLGLLLRKPWGWWGATVLFAAMLVLALKMMTPILHIDWDHPDASLAALFIFLWNGLPALVAASMLVLLFRSPMRLAYGLKQEAYVRHRSSDRRHE